MLTDSDDIIGKGKLEKVWKFVLERGHYLTWSVNFHWGIFLSKMCINNSWLDERRDVVVYLYRMKVWQLHSCSCAWACMTVHTGNSLVRHGLVLLLISSLAPSWLTIRYCDVDNVQHLHTSAYYMSIWIVKYASCQQSTVNQMMDLMMLLTTLHYNLISDVRLSMIDLCRCSVSVVISFARFQM